MLVCITKNGNLPVKSVMRWQPKLLCQCCVLACGCSNVGTFTFGPFNFKMQFGQNKALFSPKLPLKSEHAASVRERVGGRARWGKDARGAVCRAQLYVGAFAFGPLIFSSLGLGD